MIERLFQDFFIEILPEIIKLFDSGKINDVHAFNFINQVRVRYLKKKAEKADNIKFRDLFSPHM